LPSCASLIPFLWLAIISSKPVSYWLACFGLRFGGGGLEGNAADMLVHSVLIVMAVSVLTLRGFTWNGFILKNKALIAAYAYLAIGAIWADHGVPTIKRVVKDFGSVVVALVLLTEREPMDVLRVVYVRLAYLLFPLSVVLIKYFPAIGRTASRGGDAMFCGAAYHKSALGLIVFLLSLLVVIDLLTTRRASKLAPASFEWIRYGMLLVGAWLVYTCGSATALLCFALGCATLWGAKWILRQSEPGRMLFRCLLVLGCVITVEQTFQVSASVLQALGKEATLTGRTQIWEMVRDVEIDRVRGAGYLAFWHSEGAEDIQQRFAGVMNSAHNGFLDTYLDGGLIAVGLLFAVLLGWGWRNIKRMLGGSLFGRVAFMVWVLAIAYNQSESAFFRLNPMWFTLVVMCMECPTRARGATAEVPTPATASAHGENLPEGDGSAT
jgi:hypothetical protein